MGNNKAQLLLSEDQFISKWILLLLNSCMMENNSLWFRIQLFWTTHWWEI